MVGIISEKGYPKDNQVLGRVDYFIFPGFQNQPQGGILIIGKDSQGKEYKPKKEPERTSHYVLPSGAEYKVRMGEYPAIYFPFTIKVGLNASQLLEILEILKTEEELFSKFDLTLMDESMEKISLDSEVERIFKKIACWGAVELAYAVMEKKVATHFWGELYCERTTALEKFLENYRK